MSNYWSEIFGIDLEPTEDELEVHYEDMVAEVWNEVEVDEELLEDIRGSYQSQQDYFVNELWKKIV